MKEIKLSNSDKVAFVDDEDFERVSKYNWCLVKTSKFGVYVQARIFGHVVFLHRFILYMKRKSNIVEHKDNNGLNCQKSNLIRGNYSHNNFCIKTRVNNTTGILGVYFQKATDKYIARISKDSKEIALGSYENIDLAILARIIGEIKYFGHPLFVSV